MGLFDKVFKKNSGKKIRIRFVSEKPVVDEQEQFLINAEQDGYLKKAKAEQKKTVQPTPAPKKNAEPALEKAIKKTQEPIRVKVPEDEQKAAPVRKAPAKSGTNSAKKTVPVSEADKDPDEEGSVTVTEGKATRNGKFDIKKAKDGRYFFSLYASNYAVIAYSQIYSSSSAAMSGIKSIIANAEKTPIEDTTLKTPKTYPFPKWEIYIDKAGEYRFRLYATNGQCVCHSAHGYSTKSGCKGGIDSIGRFASDAAKIDKKYLK